MCLVVATATTIGCRTSAPKPEVEVAIGEVSFRPMEVKAFPDDRRPSAEAYRAALVAEQRVESGDTRAAIELFEEALVHDSKSVYLWMRLGQLRVKVGDVGGARAAAQEALDRDGDNGEALLLAALTDALSGQKDRARKTLRRALKLKPGDRNASSFLAELLLEKGRLKKAEQVIEAMMEKSPGEIDGYLTLARLYVERGDVDAALRYTSKALSRDERASEALELKLDLLLARGEFKASVPVLETLASERGDSPGMRQMMLTVRALAGDIETASALAEGWLANDPSETTVMVVAGGWESAGMRARAREALQSSSGGALTGRLAIEAGRLAFDDRDLARAQRLLCGVRSDEGDIGWFEFARALCSRAMLLQGKPSAAVAKLREGLIHTPDSWRLFTAWLWIARGASGISPEEPRAGIERARTRKPESLELLEALARATEDTGDASAARAILDDALRARAEDPERLMLLARFLERRGKGADAVEIVERLMERGQPTLEMLNFAAFTLAEIEARPDDAERYAWRALLHGPLNGYVTDTLGWTQFRAGHLDDALATLLRADRLSPDEPEILFHVAAVQQALGDLEGARLRARRALKLCPKFEPVYERIRALNRALGAGSS